MDYRDVVLKTLKNPQQPVEKVRRAEKRPHLVQLNPVKFHRYPRDRLQFAQVNLNQMDPLLATSPSSTGCYLAAPATAGFSTATVH